MESIYLIPSFQPDQIIQNLKTHPIDQKILKDKIQKIYSLSASKQQQYLPDVRQLYYWLVVFNRFADFRELIQGDKLQRYFIQQFLPISAKYLILCKKFKLAELMATTQQILIQSLNLFVKHFNQIDKYPKLILLAKIVLDIQRYFFKVNFQASFLHLLQQPTEEQVQNYQAFVDKIKIGDYVDALKTDSFNSRSQWSRAKVKKVGTNLITILFLNERYTHEKTISKPSMEIFPLKTFTEKNYDWRIQLKVGDYVDHQIVSSIWKKYQIKEIKNIEQQDNTVILLGLETVKDQIQWISATSPCIQKPDTFNSNKQISDYRDLKKYSNQIFDDFNDVLLERRKYKKAAICRHQVSKSLFYVYLTNYFNQIKGFEIIMQKISVTQPATSIELTSSLIGLVATIAPLFHRNFAQQYLPKLTDNLMKNILKASDANIRIFSKEIMDIIIKSFEEFYKRFLPISQKKIKIQQLKLELAKQFIQSGFLERKLNSLTILTELIKQSKNEDIGITFTNLEEWIINNKIIQKIYHETSHSQLIARSSDLLKVYLSSNPSMKSLQSLLQLNDAIIKLISDNLTYFPQEFIRNVANKITVKNVQLNEYILNILKKIGGYESWLLLKSASGWVEVVRQKKNKKDDLILLFKQPFNIISKVFEQIVKLDQRLTLDFILYANEIKFLHLVIDNQQIQIGSKIQFCRFFFKTIKSIDQETLEKVYKLWDQSSCSNNLNKSTKIYYQTFKYILDLLSQDEILQFFNVNFKNIQRLKSLTSGAFLVFKKMFNLLNQKQLTSDNLENSQNQINALNLIGINQLINIIFENERLEVTKAALEFISQLFDKMSQNQNLKAFIEGFLEKCLTRLYETQNHEKYLSIIQSILSQSQKFGNGNLHPLTYQLPPQNIFFTVINNFTQIKSKLLICVPSNMTIYQLRYQIGKQVNALGSQIKLFNKENLVDQHLNALSVQQSKLQGTLLVTKKYKIEKVDLISGGKLVDDATKIFKLMFEEYSNGGLMSKSDCKKLYKRIAGDSAFLIEHKIEKIFESYDGNKDGFLKVEEFLSYFENSARARPMAVWNNLENYGVREDLKILGDVELFQPDPHTLPRYILLQNKTFMELLFKLLKKQKSTAECVWNLLSRLPIYTEGNLEQLQNSYILRYWLYRLDNENNFEQKISQKLFDRILESDDETLAIGLKVVEKAKILITIEEFMKLFTRVQKYNFEQNINFYNKLILEFSLKIIVEAIKNQVQLQDQFIRNKDKFENVFLSGLMGKKQQLRNYYATAISNLLSSFVYNRNQIFTILFRMVYFNFEKCNKKDLSAEYFELFSNVLELMKTNQQLFQQLQGKNMLRNIIKIFKEHQSTQFSLNGPQDFIATGFMKLVRKMLVPDSAATELVEFLFKECLFPQEGSGIHKLKNTKSRKQAYDLIYTICKIDTRSSQNLSGLDILFKSGFKKIYKKMSEFRNSYYYSQIRSEYGYSGIRNLGCICYMISMLQQFFLTTPFKYLILMADDGEKESLTKFNSKQFDDNVLHQFQNMFANLQLTQKQQVNPQNFCLSFKDFEGNPVNVTVQQDAQQFLNMLFDRIQQSIKHTPFKHIIDGIYGGKYCNQFVCSSCKNIIERHQNFYNLSLQVKGLKNIHESFKKFITGEVISDYKCDNCNKKTQTTKRCLISKLPNYLILYLQRICFNYDKFENQKVNTRWEFPHKLNVYDYTLQKSKQMPDSKDYDYQLKGIVVHIGSAQFGHYFSYIKGDNGQWLEYNDERVREFDPKDIEQQAFGGGTGWRRDHQSAYLLLYQKVQKEKFVLEFNSQEEKQQTLSKFNLRELKIRIEQTQAQSEKNDLIQSELQLAKTQSILETQKLEHTVKEIKEVKQEKITAQIDLLQVVPYVPQKIRTEISRSNQQFTLHIHISNVEFLEFLYKISTLTPPENLKTEYLEMCYQCFTVKQNIAATEGSSEQIVLSEQMHRRFNELIKGSGWGFFESQASNWSKQIFYHQKSVRLSTKRLIISVLSDIINTYLLPLNQRSVVHTEKQQHIMKFLESYLKLMNEEVQESWMRFQQYFEVWIQLYRINPIIKKFLQENKITQILLDFLLENHSPLKLIQNRHLMGSRYMSPSFDQPLELLFEVIGQNHVFTENQLKCVINYIFLQKLVKLSPKKINIIENLCKQNSIISQRVAYTISNSLIKVTHSDDSKPLIECIHQYLNIKDSLSKKRVQWIIGFPVLEYHLKTNSFGIYGLSTIVQPVYRYDSPLGIMPILQITTVMKQRYQHITILLVSMLLQLEVDGVIKLNRIPAMIPLQMDYTFWFNGFVQAYFQQMTKPHTGDNYKNYAKRAYSLWKGRDMQNRKRYIIGKTQQQTQFRRISYQNNTLEVIQTDIIVALVQAKYTQTKILSIAKHFLHKNNPNYFTFEPQVIDSFKNSEHFFRKVTSYQNKSDEELLTMQNPFEQTMKTNYIRKIVIKNKGNQDLLVLLKYNQHPDGPSNANLPVSPLRYILKPNKQAVNILHKNDPLKEWSLYDISIQTYDATGSLKIDEYPRQLITPYEGHAQQQVVGEAQQQYEHGYYYVSY